jgi:hypothetical protein
MDARIRQLSFGAAALAAWMGAVSCGDVVRQGRSPSLIVIDTLQGASGATPGNFGVPVLSDVDTVVNKTVGGVAVPVHTIFNDLGSAQMRTLLKDPGAAGTQTAPSGFNAVSISRYHVEFVRADGRNTQGVDVPYAFDGAVTATITESAAAVPFELVRHNAKDEAPLKALVGGGGRIFISTIANVTFYGKDQVGNDVQVTGSIAVDFGDFADPS